MAKSTLAYIGLGSNLGDRKDFINKALKMLSENKNIKVVRVSDIIETAPLAQPLTWAGRGGADQPKYLNAAAQAETELTAEDLHKAMLNVEVALGRTKKEKWSSRNIDLDLLLFGEEIINSPDLTIPHPQMHLRSFVLKGLCQLDADLLHPVIRVSMKELAGRLNNADFVLNPKLPQLVSIAGIIGVGKTTLATNLSKIFSCKCIFEPYDKNPYLPEVYAGKKELALDCQLFFLTGRVAQLNHHSLRAGEMLFADYVFDKELVYAKQLLNAEQLELYDTIHKQVVSDIAAPVLVIYLTDSVENCLERIHRRNRPYEQKIQPGFLDSLSRGHEELFSDWEKCPVIRLSRLEFDYMRDENIRHLTNQIRSYIAIK
ncbi:MAG: 2-amino-4-hydroxy-6-hydroxymethyldihydropteridine diphosphokinase [Sedimentisphaerales bacterium]|nr:2-amino-4-hydroxy-6-hydroxymethyldihydropteridine diphosphokinase [Sedimentisphaerales bacterium]